MKHLLFFTVVAFAIFNGSAKSQVRYFTKTGKISFYSKATLENIEATNNKVVCVWEIASGKMEINVLIKGFEFEKALMQEHFNENYMESDLYPKAVFKGIIENSNGIDLTTNHSVSAKVNGDLTMHGVSKPLSATVSISVKNGIISASTGFNILLADYKINIPSVVSEKINKTIAIKVDIPSFQLFASPSK